MREQRRNICPLFSSIKSRLHGYRPLNAGRARPLIMLYLLSLPRAARLIFINKQNLYPCSSQETCPVRRANLHGNAIVLPGHFTVERHNAIRLKVEALSCLVRRQLRTPGGTWEGGIAHSIASFGITRTAGLSCARDSF